MQNIGKERINWIHDIHSYISIKSNPHMSKLYDLQKARRTQSQMETKTLEITSCHPLIDFKINFQLDSKKTQHISRNRFHLKQTLSCWAPPPNVELIFDPSKWIRSESRTSGPTHNTNCISPLESEVCLHGWMILTIPFYGSWTTFT